MSNFTLSFTNLLYFTAIFTSIFLAGAVYKNNKKVIGKVFTLLITSVLFWIVSNFFINNLDSYDSVLFWTRAAILGPLIMGPLFLIFVILFPEYDKLTNKKLFLLFLPTLLFAPFVFSTYNVESITLSESTSIKFQPGKLYYFLLIYIVLFFFTALGLLYRKYRRETGITKLQISIIGTGFFMSFLLALCASLILPLLGYTEGGIIGPLSTLFFLSASTYALVKYRLFEIRFVIGRGMYFIIMSSIPFTLFYALNFSYTQIFGSVYDFRAVFIGIFISILFIYFIFLASDKLNLFITKRVLDPGLTFSHTRKKLLELYNQILKTEELLVEMVNNMDQVLNSESINIAIINSEKEAKIQTFHSTKVFDIDESTIKELDNYFISLPKSRVKICALEELKLRDSFNFQKNSTLQKLFNKDYKIVIKAAINNKHDLFILYKAKIDKDAYNQQDINFIIEITTASLVALDRSLLYTEVQQFSLTLQQKVGEATKELQDTNVKLTEALRKERDMMDILGHELRTPLTIAQNAIVMMDMHTQKNNLTKEKLLELVENAKEGIRRETKILETILSSTRIENNRLQLNLEKVHANDVVHDSMEAYRIEAEKKGLKLLSIVPETSLYCLADRTSIQQIIDNLTSNAIKYTQRGSITIKLEDADSMIKFSIVDTGEGISESEIPNLGRKFYRINAYTEDKNDGHQVVRPGGTGIGLYVVKNLIQMMNGLLKVESKVAVGSTFSVYIPKYNGDSNRKIVPKAIMASTTPSAPVEITDHPSVKQK